MLIWIVWLAPVAVLLMLSAQPSDGHLVIAEGRVPLRFWKRGRNGRQHTNYDSRQHRCSHAGPPVVVESRGAQNVPLERRAE